MKNLFRVKTYRHYILLKSVIVICLMFFQTNLIKAQQQIFNHKQLITDGRVWDIAFEDLDKDGSKDLVIANWFKPPTIYYNDSNGGFNNVKSLHSVAAEEGVYVGHGVGINDFNNDDKPDILYVRNGRNNQVYLRDKDGYMQGDTLNTNNSNGLYVSLGDVDNDNDIDLFITNYKQPNILWTNDGKGNFTKNDSDFGSSGYNADFGDINNDGNLDVICSINGKVIVWFNKGNNNYERSTQSIGYSEGFGRVRLVDIDNDKDLDIILANRSAGGSIWLNDGNGTFSEGIKNLTKSSTMTVGDIDLNGQIDIIFENSIWLNNGNNQFTKNGEFEIEGRLFGLWLNDIDNDGDLDLFYSTSIEEKSLILIKNSTRGL